jgi:hypothetical protein
MNGRYRPTERLREMSVELRERNITATYRAATTAERAEGRSWYATARLVAESLDPADPVRAAAVLAVLSPRLSWERNVEAAGAAYSGQPTRTLKANEDKARRILNGEDPEDVVSGPKVRAFWAAIVDPDNAEAIVIDRHAIDIAAGAILDDEQRGKLLGRKGAYGEVAKLYRSAARRLSKEFNTDLTAVDVQATTWVSWRRAKRAFGKG